MVKVKNQIKIQVPATTANLGPGFDCLGLTLDIWNEISFIQTGNSLIFSINGEGESQLPENEENLIFRCFADLAKQNNTDIPSGLLIQCQNNIPISSGLGSSSSAVIAGLLASKVFFDLNIRDNDLLKIGYGYEGHLDNITACLKGGFSITGFNNDEIIFKTFPVEQIPVVIALPDLDLSTSTARAILPTDVPLKDAVHNIFQAALLSHAIRDGDKELLRKSMQDRLHQHYRLHRLPGGQEAINEAMNAGAIFAALSGAGPSIIAFAEKEKTRQSIGISMHNAFQTYGINTRLLYTYATNKGAYIDD